MNAARRWIDIGLLVLLAGSVVSKWIDGYQHRQELAERDALLSDAILQHARAEWDLKVELAEEKADLLDELTDSSTALGRVAGELARANEGNAILLDLNAQMRSEIEQRGTVVRVERDTVYAQCPADALVPGDQVSGVARQVPFTVPWRFTAPTGMWMAPEAELPITALFSQLPDGRLSVFLEEVPGVTFTTQRFFWQPPEPESVGWRWGTFFKTLPFCVAGGAVSWELVR